MKKVWPFLLVLTLLFVSACGGGGNSSGSAGGNAEEGAQGDTAKKYTFKLGHVASEQNSTHKAAAFFKEKVSEKTDGNVVIELYPGAQLGGERDMLESISSGTQDMGALSIGIFGNFTTALMGVQLPFAIANGEVENEFYKSEQASKLLGELQSLNVKGLQFLPMGYHELGTNKKAIASPDDMKGFIIRSPENEMMIDSFSALGANPTPMAFTEVYTALQTGVVDGTTTQPSVWISEGLAEVVENITIASFFAQPTILVVNLDIFDGLPEEYQTAIQEAAVETAAFSYDMEKEGISQHLEAMKNMGINVVTEIDREAFTTLLQPVYDKYSEKDPLIKETLEVIRGIEAAQK